VPTTTGRSRGRQGARSGAQGAVGEHTPKIMAALITGTLVVVFALVMTKPGRVMDAATQHFMLFYAGVFALIGLTASVGVGLLATDRIVMTPGHRVMAQAVHRAVSFGALAFLVIHIVTEILAQRVHVIDAVIPFLSPYRTFYIGLGTIASDLLLAIVVTSIFRKRFTAHGQAWRWRALHYSSYVAFVFGVLHGLLGGRAAKPYVDWCYGFAIAATALALVVRFLAISLRSKESVSAPPGADGASGGLGYSGASPLRSAALSMAQAQLGGTIQMLPGAAGPQAAIGMSGSQPWAAIPAPGWSASSGPFPALSASPVYAGESSYGAYQDPELMPLGSPVYGDRITADATGYPYPAAYAPRSALSAPGPVGRVGEQPLYEPGYDGPPRFMGAPRKHVPQDDLSYPYGPQSYRQHPDPGYADHRGESRFQRGLPPGTAPPRPSQPAPPAQPGRMDRGTGPIPRAATGPMPTLPTGPGSGPMPRLGPGPGARADTGPLPRADTGPLPRAGTGPLPRAATGPLPRAATGPLPRADSGPMPRLGTGPKPRAATGPMPRADSGPMPGLGARPMTRHDTGPVPRTNTGPMPRTDTGPLPRASTGPLPRADSGPMPRLGPGPAARADTGPLPRADTGPMPRAGTGPLPRADSGPMPRLGTGPEPRPVPGTARRDRTGSTPRPGTGPNPRTSTGPRPRADSGPAPMPRLDAQHGPRTDPTPRPAGRRSRRADSTDPRYRDDPGRTGGAGWQ
jgi:DMSO/TMAO reductase YedYZ heme-binding membrane subunit